MKIILFEDTPETATRLINALRAAMPRRGTAHHFVSTNGKSNGTFEARLLDELERDPLKQASLIVADRDLSRTERYTGLSEANVRHVADSLSIPQCYYTRSAGDDFIRAAEQRESQIAVSLADGEESCANSWWRLPWASKPCDASSPSRKTKVLASRLERHWHRRWASPNMLIKSICTHQGTATALESSSRKGARLPPNNSIA